MKRILIINLRRIGDIFFSTHLAQKLKKQYPHASFSYLSYKESSAAFKALTNIDNVYLIDRKTIISCAKSPVFPRQHSINNFFHSIKPVTDTAWDIVVNFSNDPVGTHISSALKLFNPKTQIIGNYQTEEKIVSSSSDVAQYLNESMSQSKNAPVHLSDCYLNLISGPATNIRPNNFAKIDPNLNQINYKKINAFRTNAIKPVIGIQLKSSNESKDIPMNVISSFCKKILESNIATPLFLISNSQEELNYAKDLCNFIGKDIHVLSTGFEELGSVLLNLDLLITPDTSVKHLADILDVTMIEYLGNANQLKQASISPNNFILINNGQDLTADLLVLSQRILNPDITKKNTYLNQVLNIELTPVGVLYGQDASCAASKNECETLFINKLILNRVVAQNKMTTTEYAKKVRLSEKALASQLTELRTEATTLSKLILNCLRSLLTTKNDKQTSRDFLLALSELLSLSETTKFLKPLVLGLKFKIEHIQGNDTNHNKKTLEAYFFEMKNQVNEVNTIIKEMEALNQVTSRSRFMEL